MKDKARMFALRGVLLLGLLMASLLMAFQSQALVSLYTVHGVVTNVKGEPIENALVSTPSDGVFTDAAGSYELTFTFPGNYKITADHPLYFPMEKETGTLLVPGSNQLDFVLTVRSSS